MIRKLLTLSVGPAPRDVPDSVAAGLGYHDIVSSFRAGATPAQVLALIAAASSTNCQATATDGTPPLDRLPGYGDEMMRFGLDLARDMVAWRKGDLPWSDVAPSASCILSGGPGCGKTLYAKSLAVTCGVPLVHVSMGDVFASTDGHLNSVCRAFSDAFFKAVAIGGLFFVDEVDAIPSRDALSNENRDYFTVLITFILTLLDGATSRDGVILIGCSNHADRLDPALIRPGRFGRVLQVNSPDADGLADIVKFHLRGALADADIASLARLVPGATGADAAQWVGDARRIARQAGRDVIFDDLVAVVAPADGRSPADLWLAAVHELPPAS